MNVQYFVENAVCGRSHVSTLTLTQRKRSLKVSLGDYHFTESQNNVDRMIIVMVEEVSFDKVSLTAPDNRVIGIIEG